LIKTLIIWLALMAVPASGATCKSLAGLELANATITVAQTVNTGSFVVPPESRAPSSDFFIAFSTLRAFCRVQGVIRPSSGSHIEFEVWLPASNWNGKYEGAGNGGFGGSINYYRLAEAVDAGYAGSSTDTGHKGSAGDRSWALGHLEKVVDFNYRAVHETAKQAKAVIRAFYGEAPKRSYFSSCSNGGRQGLMEAQRYPADYDGILAGAPWTPGVLSSNPSAQTASEETALNLNASNADLAPFKERGGKLILYHGENDAPVPTVTYYKSVMSKMGKQSANEFVRLYVVPGMGHCEGGSVAGDFGQRLSPVADTQHSISMALEIWVERGIAPDRIIAAKYKTDGVPPSGIVRTRPICPYPQVAHYAGSGSSDEAANFICVDSKGTPSVPSVGRQSGLPNPDER
jgi:Tannase and feruloyl esterase